MSHSLFEINEFIRRVVALNLPEALWIRAELADVKISKGHIYLDLVQKSENSETIIAQSQGVIWSKNHRLLQRKLGSDLDSLLHPGHEILFLAKPEFHERFGLKLMLEDIDPAHTLGKLEMQRRETIRKLQSQNLLVKNKLLPLPPVVQRIAVLSSERAAGLQDFMKHLVSNPYGYQFKVDFFPVAVQGIGVEAEVVAQLESIAKSALSYDAVAIIRGGGARLDLTAFDSFILAKTVANLRLPVLAGIGHDVDETVLDLVAHTSLKTPTAVADFLLHRNLDFESQIMGLGLEIKNHALRAIHEQGLNLQQLAQLADHQLKSDFRRKALMLDFIAKEIPMTLKNLFGKAQAELSNFEKIIQLLGPETAFQRGFAMVFKQGRQVKDATQLEPLDEVLVQMKSGKFQAAIIKIEK